MKNELMPGVQSVNEAWQVVIDNLRSATMQLIDLTDTEKAALQDTFWHSHPAIMEKYEIINPGITEQVFLSSEELCNTKLQADQDYFDKVTLPKVKRRAFISGLLGRQIVFPYAPND
jgi:hypothetical protein